MLMTKMLAQLLDMMQSMEALKNKGMLVQLLDMMQSMEPLKKQKEVPSMFTRMLAQLPDMMQSMETLNKKQEEVLSMLTKILAQLRDMMQLMCFWKKTCILGQKWRCASQKPQVQLISCPIKLLNPYLFHQTSYQKF